MSTVKSFSFWEWVHVIGVFGGLAALIATCVNFLNNQKAEIDRKISAMEHRMDLRDQNLDRSLQRLEASIQKLETTVSEVKADLKKTSDLLHADLSWRYLYQNDPSRKHLVPRYNLDTRTLEFVASGSGNVRNP